MDEPARQRAPELVNTPEFAQALRERKKLEALFAELKNQIGLRRLRLRTLKFVCEQFFLAATAQNIKRLVRFLSPGQKPMLAISRHSIAETKTSVREPMPRLLFASLIYFTGTSYPKDNDPVPWMQKSYALSDAIEARPNNKDTCGSSGARIEEFLYRLARGDRQNDLLTQAAQHLGDDSTTRPALINYLSGSLDVKAFETAIESSKLTAVAAMLTFTRCGTPTSPVTQPSSRSSARRS